MNHVKTTRDTFDPLLQCLHFVGKYYGKVFSDTSLTMGLALVDHKLTPQLFVQASERIGLKSKPIQRELEHIPALVLPCVLVLNDNECCVLTRLVNENQVEIVSPELENAAATVAVEDLKERYSGYAILVQPEYQFDKRSDEFNLPEHRSWFWSTLWRYRGIYLQVVVAALVINILGLLTPFYVMNVYDRVVPNNAMETLFALSAGVLGAIAFDFILKIVKAKLIDTCGKKADIILSARIFRKLVSLKTSAQPQSIGSMASSLKEFESIREFFASSTVATLVDLPFIFVSITVIYMIAGPIAIIPTLAVPVVLGASFLFEIPMRQKVQESSKGNNQKHAVLVEVLGNLSLIKALGAQSYFQRQWESSVAKIADCGMAIKTYGVMAQTFSGTAIQTTTIVIVICGVGLITSGDLTVGALVATTLLTGKTLAPLGQFAGLITRLNQSRQSLEALNALMDSPSERSNQQIYTYKDRFEGKIEFRDASFTYPEAKLPALEHVSLTIEAGEHVAILGHNGSGKTTLQQLILAFYDPDEGVVLVDDTDMSQIDPADLRRNIGYVPQNCALFYGSIRHNITISKPWATHEELYTAAEMSGIAEFVKRHPEGYDLQLGEGGAGLSGGQRQAIAISRALLCHPPILLFDEPTAAMDKAAEAHFIQTLKEYSQGRTMILVTHKDELLELVDRVILMHQGRIIADESKDAMMAKLANARGGSPQPQGGNAPAKTAANQARPSQRFVPISNKQAG